jgi:anti-anti-sigma factor
MIIIEPTPLSIRSSRDGPLHRLVPHGELDIATAADLERAFDAVFADDSVEMIVVDLTELGFMDSTGTKLLLQMYVSCEHGDRLRIVNGSRTVARVLDLTGVRDRLPIIEVNDDPLAPLPPARRGSERR